MSTALLVRRDLGISFTPEAHTAKTEALEAGALIGRVSNADEQELAVRAQQKIKALRDTVEKARKKAKEPLIEAGRQLDATCKAFCEELENEWGRITDLVGEFQREERRRADREREEQEKEQRRIEAEKQAELRRIAAAEAAQRAELERQAKAARDEAERQRIVAEQAALEAQTQQKMAAVTEQAAQQIATAAAEVSAPAQAAGQIVKEDWEIQVTNPYELAKWHPDCVLRIEPSLSAIKARLNQGMEVRGVSARKITKASVRTTAQKAIEV